MPELNNKVVLALVRDLIFRSKIDAAALGVGVEPVYASSLDAARRQCEANHPKLILVDLSDSTFLCRPVLDMARAASPGARLAGFASHVDLKTLKAARDMGFDAVMSRSEFTVRIPDLLRSLA